MRNMQKIQTISEKAEGSLQTDSFFQGGNKHFCKTFSLARLQEKSGAGIPGARQGTAGKESHCLPWRKNPLTVSLSAQGIHSLTG